MAGLEVRWSVIAGLFFTKVRDVTRYTYYYCFAVVTDSGLV